MTCCLRAENDTFVHKRSGKLAVRFDITRGDRTTNGGTVIEGDAFDTINGREQAYENAEVWCPECETTGHIVCVGTEHTMTGPDGRRAALSDDLCVCQCEPSPRLIASQYVSYCLS